MSDNVHELPGEVVDLDLDLAIEEEKKAPSRRPFTFKLAGRVISMSDPEDLDWRDAALLDDPLQLVRHCMSDDDRRFLLEKEGVKTKIFAKIFEGFSVHYGLEKKYTEMQRQQRLAAQG